MSEYWRHVKRGTIYEVLGLGQVQTEDWGQDNAAVMIYRSEDGLLWVRPHNEFMDGRFERLDELRPAERDPSVRLHVLKKLLFEYSGNQTLAASWLAALDAVDPLRGGQKP